VFTTQEFKHHVYPPNEVIQNHWHLMVMDAGHISEINLQRDEVDTNDDVWNPFASTLSHSLVSYTER
jgi:hypothetical protein